MNEAPTNGELKIMLDALTDKVNEKFGDVMVVVKEIRDDVKEVKVQTTKTNGRINKVEDRLSDYETTKDTVSNLVNYKWWIAGAIAMFMLLGGTIAMLIYNNIDTKIQKGIEAALDNRVQNVQTAK